MILASDIVRLGFKFDPNDMQGPYLVMTSEETVADVGWQGAFKYRIKLSDSREDKKRLIIKENRKHFEVYQLETIFDGYLYSPADLLRLFQWLQIPLPENIK